MSFILIVFSIFTSLLFQNCAKLTAFDGLSKISAQGQPGFTFSSLYCENNGEGYFGRPYPEEYVRSYDGFNCETVNQLIKDPIEKNIQGVATFDGLQALFSMDNCSSINKSISSSDPLIDYQPFNLDLFLVAGLPFEKKSIFAQEGSKSIEVFCRQSSGTSGMDLIIKYDDPSTSSVKILIGQKRDETVWDLSIVPYFKVSEPQFAI